jgi:eukaryotic-like serine/threonine-protein kinase
MVWSKIKGGRHMGVATATESRTERHDVYLPADHAGMVDRSALSPNHKWLLIGEMDSVRGWLPCRVMPFDGSSPGNG